MNWQESQQDDFTHSDIVTAAVNDINFLHPMPLGSFLDLTAQVVHVGNSSLKSK